VRIPSRFVYILVQISEFRAKSFSTKYIISLVISPTGSSSKYYKKTFHFLFSRPGYIILLKKATNLFNRSPHRSSNSDQLSVSDIPPYSTLLLLLLLLLLLRLRLLALSANQGRAFPYYTLRNPRYYQTR
jgi:hypothetical protein